jgi:hypothetical protein
MNMIPEYFSNAFAAAVENTDNYREDGSINWDFVSADLWMDGIITVETEKKAMEWFDDLADMIEGK